MQLSARKGKLHILAAEINTLACFCYAQDEADNLL